jgi:hypothetical protein
MGWIPRKFLRMAALGMDDEIAKSNWPWMCSMCQRCIYVCPDENRHSPIGVQCPGAASQGRAAQGDPRLLRHGPAKRKHQRHGNLTGRFRFVVEDVLEEYQEAQPEFADMQAPIDKQGAEFF